MNTNSATASVGTEKMRLKVIKEDAKWFLGSRVFGALYWNREYLAVTDSLSCDCRACIAFVQDPGNSFDKAGSTDH